VTVCSRILCRGNDFDEDLTRTRLRHVYEAKGDLPDEAAVPVSEFNDHEELDMNKFKWCSEVYEEGVVQRTSQRGKAEREEAVGILLEDK
jgi:hypothetical protein